MGPLNGVEEIVMNRETKPIREPSARQREIETQVEQLQGQIKENRDEVNRLRKAREDYVSNMNVE